MMGTVRVITTTIIDGLKSSTNLKTITFTNQKSDPWRKERNQALQDQESRY